MIKHTGDEIHTKTAKIFWAEIAPCEHVVQVYENDGVFLDALTGFVGGGINEGDAVIVIATEAHQRGLENRLTSYGLYVDSLIAEGLYIPLNAEKMLAKFMIGNWPDEALFTHEIAKLINRAGAGNRRIRAFGEMVAVLWAQGHYGATVQLEHLWERLSKKESFCLFCAYPKTGFTKDMTASLEEICGCHSRVLVDSDLNAIRNISYRNTRQGQSEQSSQ